MVNWLVTNQLTALIVAGLLLIFVWAIMYMSAKNKLRKQRVAETRKILEFFSAGTNPAVGRLNAREALKSSDTSATAIKSDSVRHAWLEFDETLVVSPDHQKIWNTTGAEEFFRTETIAGELLHNRVLNLVPGTLTALGVMGTFLGLTIGLSGLQVGNDADPDALRDGIQKLISGASMAFITSLAGIVLSLLASTVKGSFERKSIRDISALQTAIDEKFERQSPEQSLLNIVDASNASSSALQQLHERIGDQFQKSMQGLTSEIQNAVTSAINSALAPAMTSLVESTSQQSTQVFEELVGKFASSFENIGTSQATQLNQASEGLNSSVTQVADEFSGMMAGFQKQFEASQNSADKSSAEFQEQLSQLLHLAESQHSASAEAMDKLGQFLAEASTSLESSSNNLTGVSQNFKESSNKASNDLVVMSGNLNTAASHITSAAEHQTKALNQLSEQREQLMLIQQQVRELAVLLDHATEKSATTFGTLGEQQELFLSELQRNVETVHESLQSSVSTLTSDMNAWLQNYGRTVSDHTRDRMNEWNSQTQDFSRSMVQVAHALENVLDEMPKAVR